MKEILDFNKMNNNVTGYQMCSRSSRIGVHDSCDGFKFGPSKIVKIKKKN